MKLIQLIVRNYHLIFNRKKTTIIKMTYEVYNFGDIIQTSEKSFYKYLGKDLYLLKTNEINQ